MEPTSAGQGVGAGRAYTAPGSGGSGTEGASSPSSQLLLLLQLLSEEWGCVEWVAGGPGDGGAPKNSLESRSGSQLYQRWGLPPSPQPQLTEPANEVRVEGGAPLSKQTLSGELGESPGLGPLNTSLPVLQTHQLVGSVGLCSWLGHLFGPQQLPS